MVVLPSLRVGMTYFAIRAIDAAGNISALSEAVVRVVRVVPPSAGLSRRTRT